MGAQQGKIFAKNIFGISPKPLLIATKKIHRELLIFYAVVFLVHVMDYSGKRAGHACPHISKEVFQSKIKNRRNQR